MPILWLQRYKGPIGPGGDEGLGFRAEIFSVVLGSRAGKSGGLGFRARSLGFRVLHLVLHFSI